MTEGMLYPEEDLLIDTPFLRRLRETSWREGWAEGWAEGLRDGHKQGKLDLRSRQLRQRFGELPTWANSRLQPASVEELEHWSLRVLDAQRLEGVFEED